MITTARGHAANLESHLVAPQHRERDRAVLARGQPFWGAAVVVAVFVIVPPGVYSGPIQAKSPDMIIDAMLIFPLLGGGASALCAVVIMRSISV